MDNNNANTLHNIGFLQLFDFIPFDCIMIKGPKTILAETIAHALADYFVVDEKSMESNLLSDAGIKLHGTQLQPQDGIEISPTTRASIRGLVQYVAFEWHWGKSQQEGGSDWVKDVRLSISGLRFTITLTTTDLSPATNADSGNNHFAQGKSTTSNGTKTEATGIMAYVQDQVQRMLDTLTLVVDNILFTIILPDGSNLQFGGSALEISSLGLIPTLTEEGPKVLMQKLQIQRLYSLVTSKGGDTFPVLGDFYYEARIERSVENRFISGLEHGLRIEGDSDDNGVVVYAGPKQLEVFNTLIGLIVVPGQPTGSSNSQTNTDCETQSSAPVTKPEIVTNEVPSFMGLKLSGVSLVLPNETKLSLNDLILKYRFDRTMLQVEGNSGFAVDAFPFLALGETSTWSADMIQSIFRIEDTALTDNGRAADEMVVFLNAPQEHIKKVSDGLNQALGIYQRLASMEEGAASTLASKSGDADSKSQKNASAAGWSMELLGKVGCVIEQEADSEIVLTLRNIKASSETMVLGIDSVDECQIPGLLHLAEPIVDTRIKFEGSSLCAIVQEVVVVLSEKVEQIKEGDKSKGKMMPPKHLSPMSKKNSAMPTPNSDKAAATSSALPLGLCLVVKKFIAFNSDGKSVHTTVNALDFKIEPKTPDDKLGAGNATIMLTIDEVNHDMLRMKQPCVDFAVDLSSSLDKIYDLNFGANEIRVAAGYSIGDWKSLIPKKRRERNQVKPLILPNAHIDKLMVVVLVKGLIGFNDSIIRVPPFDGTENTTIHDIVRFYNERVITQVPGMIANTRVFGTNVSDGLVSHFGGGFLASAVGSTGIGGLVSVAAFDGVKNTIKAGKVSRGVSETEKWRLSDLAHGLKHTAVRVTREGAAKRGKGDGEKGDPIDWAVGATTDVATYSNKNKARLGGAGAGAAGFAMGFAVGGPVGAIAGTIIASATTQKSIEKVEDALKKSNTKEQMKKTQEMIKDINPRPNSQGLLQYGFLLKRRDFLAWGWNPHCFVLVEGELKYYDLSAEHPSGDKTTEGILYMDSSKGPHKVLKFNNHRVEIADRLSNPTKKLFIFTIHTCEKREPLWVLAAPTEELRLAWVSKLLEQMSRYSNPMNSVSDKTKEKQ